MGYKPKFIGRWGDKVTEENMNDGNFVHDPGYWKLLIDRRMYDRNGEYQWLDPVTSENFEPDLVNPLKTGKEFNITQVADDKDAEDIAERVYNNMAERDGGVAKVDYGKPLGQIMDEYDAALSAGVQANVKLTEAEEDALDDMEESMEEEDEGSGVLFSTSEEIEELNNLFNEQLQQQIEGTLPQGHVYEMGTPSVYLLSTKIPYLPIRLQASVLNRKTNDPAHPYDLSEVHDLVKLIQKPIAIFKYGDEEKAQNLMVGISQDVDDGRQFLVGLALNPSVNGKELEINSVRNVFPKNFHDWVHWINQGKMLRVDGKEEIQAIIDALRINPVDYISDDDLDNATKIVKDFPNPELPTEKNAEKAEKSSETTENGENMLMSTSAAEVSEEERDGGVAKVDYSKPLDKIMDEYDAALAAGVQANVRLTEAEEDALDDMEEAMEEEGVDSGVMFSNTLVDENSTLEETNENFNKELGAYENGTLPSNTLLAIGYSKGVLAKAIPSKPIVLRQKVLTKALKKHGLEVSDVKNLPSALADPIFIFKSSASTISILTELQSKDGKNVFVAIELDATKQFGHEFLEVNDVLTIHGREEENIVKPILENDSLVWVDKEKGHNWLSSAKSNSQAITNDDLDIAAKIIQDFDNSKFEKEKAEKSSETTENGENMLFSTSPAEVSEEEREVLMGIHNITAAKLRSAIGLGGLANPSMAVVDTTKGLLNNFGEISLIPGSDLIDKRKGRNAGTFTADAYTPRFPTVHRRLGKGGEKKQPHVDDSRGVQADQGHS